jgi:glycosyltransferase involved in cell wall biosynthesis
MATLNGARYIEEQVDSVLAQLSGEDELLVSDDGSTDGTVELLEAYGDPRIKVRRRGSATPSVAANFGAALARASGQYVFLADQDDVWCPTKVGRMVGCLRESDVVVCDCAFMDESGDTVLPSFFRVRRSGTGFLRNVIRNGYMGCCMAFRRSLLTLCLPLPERVPHDQWIGLVGELTGRTCFLGEQLVMYRCHARNVSPTATGLPYPVDTRLWQRGYLLWLVAQRMLRRRMMRHGA